jgi:hypothetical protein
MEKIIELFKNSGFTAVVASFLTILVGGIINWKIDKNREQQIFVRQILPNRMKAHGALLKALVLMHDKFVGLLSKPPADRPLVIMKQSNKFRDLHLRNIIWLESGVQEYCSKIHELLFNAVKSGKEEMPDRECEDLLGIFTLYHGEINKIIIAASGIRLLDKTLKNFSITAGKSGRNKKINNAIKKIEKEIRNFSKKTPNCRKNPDGVENRNK